MWIPDHHIPRFIIYLLIFDLFIYCLYIIYLSHISRLELSHHRWCLDNTMSNTSEICYANMIR